MTSVMRSLSLFQNSLSSRLLRNAADRGNNPVILVDRDDLTAIFALAAVVDMNRCATVRAMDLLQHFLVRSHAILTADQRPLIGQEFLRRLGAGDDLARRILDGVIHNARAQLHNEVIVNLVLIVADDAAAQHRNTLHVIGLAVALERIQLTLKLAVQRVRHQRAHGLPLLVLPAVLHLDISIGYLFQEFLRREVRIFFLQLRGVDRAFIRRYSARRRNRRRPFCSYRSSWKQ